MGKILVALITLSTISTAHAQNLIQIQDFAITDIARLIGDSSDTNGVIRLVQVNNQTFAEVWTAKYQSSPLLDLGGAASPIGFGSSQDLESEDAPAGVRYEVDELVARMNLLPTEANQFKIVSVDTSVSNFLPQLIKLQGFTIDFAAESFGDLGTKQLIRFESPTRSFREIEYFSKTRITDAATRIRYTEWAKKSAKAGAVNCAGLVAL